MRAQVGAAGLSSRIAVESAGTAGYHAGERADARARAAAKARGLDLAGRARQFVAADFARFEFVLAMDRANHDDLLELASNEAERAKVALLRSFDATAPRGAGVPDPYYGGDQGFVEVLEICERACAGLLAHVREQHGL